MKALCLLALVFTGIVPAEAARRLPIAGNMSCAQAVGYYQKHKRIYVIANGNDVVPIFGHKPAAEWQNLVCSRGSSPRFYWVDTLDRKRCAIAAYCQ